MNKGGKTGIARTDYFAKYCMMSLSIIMLDMCVRLSNGL